MRKYVVYAILMTLSLIFHGVSIGNAVAQPISVTVDVTADSQADGYEAWRVLDGDTNTLWHTEFRGTSPVPPHELTINLKGNRAIREITLFPRTDMTNGNFKKFAVYNGNDKKNLTFVIEYEMTTPQQPAHLVFEEPLNGRYLMIRTFDEVEGRNWSAIAELQLVADGVQFVANRNLSDVPEELDGIVANPELMQQYVVLCHNIKNRERHEKYADQVFAKDAMILDTDRDPTDVVYRRTVALWEDIKSELAVKGGDQPHVNAIFEATVLKHLTDAMQSIAVDDVVARYRLYEDICKIRRQIAFSNPLLDFDELLFVKRHRATYNHMCDQFYGVNSVPGGGVFVLSKPFDENPVIRNLLADSVVKNGRLKGKKLDTGAFVTPNLSFDGKKLAFAYVECQGDKQQRFHTDLTHGHWDVKDSHHLFTVNVDGSELTQLTDGTWNDFDPCWLPNGRIAFISERRGGYLRCGRECPNYTLFDMADDGLQMRCLSYHETNEWGPSVTHDGRIVYTRWDYVDRHGCTAHHPWITTLDGRDARAVHGNFTLRNLRSDMELGTKAIPDSPKYVATAAPHHGQQFGSLVIIDPRVEDDHNMAPEKRITPDVDFPETQGGAQVYGTPWPLSEKYYLAVADFNVNSGMGSEGTPYFRGDYGIYLVDAFGNKELLYRDPDIGSLSPIPLRARHMPTATSASTMAVAPNENHETLIASNDLHLIRHQPYVVPKRGDETPMTTISIVNVYDSWVPLPENTEIKELRVLQIIPMSVPSGRPPHEVGLREPTSGDSVVLSRYVLGTVPVESDGSVHFKAPAERELVFQLIDKDGLAIQSMRSATYLQEGEMLVCNGCHEQQHRTPLSSSKVPLAMRRAASELKPDAEGSNPFSYPILVQPVLDKYCIGCHNESGDVPVLTREPISNYWYASYNSLVKNYGFYSYGNPVRTYPEAFGAKTTPLYKLLKNGHHDVKLTDEEMHRVTLWLDCCSIFYGVYEKEAGEVQLRGEYVLPTLE